MRRRIGLPPPAGESRRGIKWAFVCNASNGNSAAVVVVVVMWVGVQMEIFIC